MSEALEVNYENLWSIYFLCVNKSIKKVWLFFTNGDIAVETDNLQHTSNLICSLDADIVFYVTGSWQILYINCCGSLNEPENCVLLLKGARVITWRGVETLKPSWRRLGTSWLWSTSMPRGAAPVRW